jgi:hypothetical protein
MTEKNVDRTGEAASFPVRVCAYRQKLVNLQDQHSKYGPHFPATSQFMSPS